MDTPVSDTSRTTLAWSSLIDSMRGCTLGGSRILKEELRQKITIQSKDVAAGEPPLRLRRRGCSAPRFGPGGVHQFAQRWAPRPEAQSEASGVDGRRTAGMF
ncbi:hypothetical protein ACSBR2_022283 [Camellia fascicularis]